MMFLFRCTMLTVLISLMTFTHSQGELEQHLSGKSGKNKMGIFSSATSLSQCLKKLSAKSSLLLDAWKSHLDKLQHVGRPNVAQHFLSHSYVNLPNYGNQWAGSLGSDLWIISPTAFIINICDTFWASHATFSFYFSICFRCYLLGIKISGISVAYLIFPIPVNE